MRYNTQNTGINIDNKIEEFIVLESSNSDGVKKSRKHNPNGHKSKKSVRHPQDYYASPDHALTTLFKTGFKLNSQLVWEICTGKGSLSKQLIDSKYTTISTDIENRGFGLKLDFFNYNTSRGLFKGSILTNPPFSDALKIIQRSLDIICDGGQVIMLLRIQFVESKIRRIFFDQVNNPKYIYVSSSRLTCAIDGNFDALTETGEMCLAWYIFEKGYKGDTILRWFN